MSKAFENHTKTVESGVLSEIQHIALNEAVDVLSQHARIHLGISKPGYDGIELDNENRRFMVELCLANREYVLGCQAGKIDKVPTRSEWELSFYGDVLVAMHTLAKKNFFTKENQAKNLSCTLIDSRFSPSAAVRMVNNPATYVSKELDRVSPEMVTNLIFAWQDIAEQWPDGKAEGVGRGIPSVPLVYEVLKSLGVNLNNEFIDLDDIDIAFSKLEPKTISVTPELASDPLRETEREKYKIVVGAHDTEGRLSCELDDLRWAIGDVIGRSYFDVINAEQFGDLGRYYGRPSAISYDIHDAFPSV
jgi:hypothetical protein